MLENNCYKVSVRKGLGNGDWKDFSKVIFEVSLDNKRYRGDSFFSILNWAKTRFQHIHIIICDSLQRYNIAFDRNINEQAARNLAKEKGRQWLYEAQTYFNQLHLHPEITKWDEWLEHNPTLYHQYSTELYHLYKTHDKIRDEVNQICNQIWQRRSKIENLSQGLENHFKSKVVIPYFFEETALSSVFLPIVGGVSAYPGSLPKFWEYFIEGKINKLEGFKNHTFINLDLKKASKTISKN